VAPENSTDRKPMSSGDDAIASVYERTGAQPGRWWQAVRRETILPFVRAALLITILSVALLPIVYLLALSFKTPDQVLEGLFLPTKPTLRNWINIFQNVPLALYIANSAISAISGSLITLVITIPAVYALSRIRIGAFLVATVAKGRDKPK
jgi:ABC-type glycerol-3-phosphate transport system permease component